MPEHEIVGEIKRLLAEGLNQKALMAGSDYAIEPLRRAVVLSKQTDNVIWANVPKYRLAHLLFRHAKTTEQLEEISELLEDVISKQSSRKLDFLCQILLIAVTCRLKGHGSNREKVDLAEITANAASNLRFYENESTGINPGDSNLQGDLFNLLELSTYFSGEDYTPLEGLCLSPNYIELIPVNTPKQNLWRIVLPNGKLDAFAYTREMAENELEYRREISNSDFYYIFDNNGPAFFRKDAVKIEFEKYPTGTRSSPAFLVKLHGHQNNWVQRTDTNKVINITGSGDKTNVIRQVRKAIRDALGSPNIIETNHKMGDRLSLEANIVGMISQNQITEFFSNG